MDGIRNYEMDFFESRDTCSSCGEYCCEKRYWSYLSVETNECETCYEQSKLEDNKELVNVLP
jgi:hypothetical protein